MFYAGIGQLSNSHPVGALWIGSAARLRNTEVSCHPLRSLCLKPPRSEVRGRSRGGWQTLLYPLLLGPLPGKPGTGGMLRLSIMSDSATSLSVAHQSPLSMEFFRQEYWSSLPFPPPGVIPDPGIQPASLPSCIGRQILYHCATWESREWRTWIQILSSVSGWLHLSHGLSEPVSWAG